MTISTCKFQSSCHFKVTCQTHGNKLPNILWERSEDISAVAVVAKGGTVNKHTKPPVIRFGRWAGPCT